jgi:chitodextrinase
MSSVHEAQRNGLAHQVPDAPRLPLTIYYAANITGSAANGNTVTVTFTAPAVLPAVRIAEYGGLALVDSLDVTAAVAGTGNTSDSGAVTTNANDLLVGPNLVQTQTTATGAEYTSRVITSPNGDILEDCVVTSVGSYRATAAISPGPWIMQLVAFRAAASVADTTPPTVPTGLSATAASAFQVNLTWTASTDDVAVTGYRIYRDSIQVGTSATHSYSDAGLLPSTTYEYTVCGH